MNKIILVPGSFNPVTNAHFEMAETAAKLVSANNIYFIPANDKYLIRKNCKIIPGKDRGQLILDGSKERLTHIQYNVDFNEILGQFDGKTYHTVQWYKDTYPNTEIYVVLGGDNLEQLTSWYDWEKFVSTTRFIFCARNNNKIDIPHKLIKYIDNFNFISLESNDISSTKVRYLSDRHRFEELLDIVPKCVLNYMEEKYVRI